MGYRITDDNIQFDAIPVSSLGVGVKAGGTTVTVVESGVGILHKTVLTLAAHTVALTDEAGVVAYLGSQLYDFPAGAIRFEGVITNLAITKSSAGVNDDWDGDYGIGTVTASNNNALTSTEDNLLPSTATAQASAGATTAVGVSTDAEDITVNGTTTAVDLYLNVLVDDADHDVTGTACNFIFNGTVIVYWKNLGDY